MKEYILFDGDISILNEYIENLGNRGINNYNIVCKCSFNDYLELKRNPAAKKTTTFFWINEHSYGLKKQLLSKKMPYVLWAMINRAISNHALKKCKKVIIATKDEEIRFLNTYLISDINSNIMKKMLSSRPKMILRRRGFAVRGLFSDIMVWAAALRFAYENNLPVYFDLKHYENMYQENRSENAWEYYYEQKSDEPVDGEYVLVSDLITFPNDYNWKLDVDMFLGLGSVYKSYLSLNSRMTETIDLEWREYKARIGNKKVLGVKFRGTDYKSDYVPAGHGIQCSCQEMIKNVSDFLETYDYEYVYLAVEEEETIKKFIDYFGADKVLFKKEKYISGYNGQYGTSIVARELYGPKQSGTVYVSQIEGLLRCDSLICNLNSGAMITIARKGKEYEHLIIVNAELTKHNDNKLSDILTRNDIYMSEKSIYSRKNRMEA